MSVARMFCNCVDEHTLRSSYFTVSLIYVSILLCYGLLKDFFCISREKYNLSNCAKTVNYLQ